MVEYWTGHEAEGDCSYNIGQVILNQVRNQPGEHRIAPTLTMKKHLVEIIVFYEDVVDLMMKNRTPSIQFDHHVAQGRVIFQPIHGHVLSVTRLLHAPVGHFVGQCEVGVDPGAAVLEAAGDVHGPADVPGPHG